MKFDLSAELPIHRFYDYFNKFLVTGPQRSGTRIMAKMISYDNNIRYVSEQEIKIRNIEKVERFLKQEERLVIQCPGLCHRIHEFSREDTLIVMMIRNVEDIIRSQKRIKWGKFEKKELEYYGKTKGVISKVKYEQWEKQKEQIINWIEIDYDSLKDHPLFIPKEERKNFRWNQTERDKTLEART